jgi:endonuclease I
MKGEVARALFYMDVRFDGYADTCADTCSGEESWLDLQLLDVAVGGAELLLDWHRRFPPTAREQARSAEAAAIQGAANPFVENPELARCLFATPTPPPNPPRPP